ncbi:MAG TPA: Holliday junction resolvase RuvX [Candidatus Saccharimonadales bacterium]|jgi:putative Holliday junction resolvase|nr:Holliday junction resolvase RuvX [Candidatus Saccharimonadales bacterium]
MKIIGIDYGRSKMGLAFADGSLAEPLKVIRYEDTGLVAEQIKKIITENGVEKVVVGVSEGEMGRESKNFSLNFGKMLGIPVETFDETLSTQEAQILSREAGIHQKKRHQMEDAYAATIMLQNYLDTLVK